MTDVELFAFMAIFRTLLKVFPKRVDEESVTALGQVYFKALKRFTIGQIQAGADNYAMRGKFFPKPAEWSDAIPRVSAVAALEPLSALEASVYLDAEGRHYNGDPCGCPDCRATGVDHRFVRFVPDTLSDGRDAHAKIGDRQIVRGHWTHGDELRRWYLAKEQFWDQFRDLCDRGAMEKKELRRVRDSHVLPPDVQTRIEQAFQPREPGIEG